MRLLTFGINYQTAPLELREKAAFVPERLSEALQQLTTQGAAEATILSTCNRTEIYCGLADERDEQLIAWFCDYHRLQAPAIQPYLYRYPNQAAVRHAFRVASGLDSMVLGEPQILGQMKDAFTTAHKVGVTGKILNRLFQQTFSVAKQIRTDTAIGTSAVSVASAAVQLARQIFSALEAQTVLLIGAGETIDLCARHLRSQNVKHIIIANRTVERAERLGSEVGAEAISLAEMPARLPEADIVISSTASQLPILGKGAVERALKARRHRPMFIVDLAVPRDVEAEVGDLNDVYLYTVDDLQDVVQTNLESRQSAALEAEKIIDAKVIDFMQWVQTLDVEPTIRALRNNADAIRETELERARRALARGDDPKAVLEQLARALTNKFTHAPSVALKNADRDGNDALLEAARRLFDLDEN
jgi:glutamyl-tRNA reductase